MRDVKAILVVGKVEETSKIGSTSCRRRLAGKMGDGDVDNLWCFLWTWVFDELDVRDTRYCKTDAMFTESYVCCYLMLGVPTWWAADHRIRLVITETTCARPRPGGWERRGHRHRQQSGRGHEPDESRGLRRGVRGPRARGLGPVPPRGCRHPPGRRARPPRQHRRSRRAQVP